MIAVSDHIYGETVNYNSFDWNNNNWTIGNAAFGDQSYPNWDMEVNTIWPVDTDLALQKTIAIAGTIGNVTLNIAVDNGFVVFVNGQEIARENEEGFTSYWEYTYNINSLLFRQGMNTVSVLAEDHGGSTFFDMQSVVSG